MAKIVKAFGVLLLTLGFDETLAAGDADTDAASCADPAAEADKKYPYTVRDFNGVNGFEAAIDPDIVLEVYADYEKDVKPYLGTNKSTDDFCLVTPYRPGTKTWDSGGDKPKSDIKWYSVNNEKTYQKYIRHVERLGLKDILKEKEWIDSDNITVYTMFLIVRQHSEKNEMHLDWSEDIETQVTTFLVPLSDFHIGMDYQDLDGEVQHYDYRLGKAVGVGGGLMHSTGVGHGETEDVLLCVYLGSDDEEIWDMALGNINDELEHYMNPIDCVFMRNENLEGGPSKCQ